MQTILLFGGFGFIGSNLLQFIDDYLLDKYEVIVFDKQAKHPFDVKFKCIRQMYTGDFGNIADIQIPFQKNKIDAVFHFLSNTVPATSGDIRFDIESNLIATINVLDLMVKHEINNIVYLSSGGAIYGNTSNQRHHEGEDVFPISSYGIVKLACEKYIHVYSQLKNINYLILRISNPYGPFHISTKQGIINIAIKKLLIAEPLTIWGDGTNKKDYIFINDVISILIKLLENKVSNQVINIGSGIEHSLNEIVSIIHGLNQSFVWQYSESKSFDNSSFRLDIGKLMQTIGDYPYTSLEQGMQKTYQWYLHHQK